MQPQETSPEVNLQDPLRQAMDAHGKGQVQEAREAYLAVLKTDPDNPDALHLLGVLHGQFGSDELAAQLIGRAIEINPSEAMFHNNLGNVYLNLRLAEDAEAAYRRAVALNPQRHDAVNNLAVLVGRRGDTDAAEKLFKDLLEVAPGFTDARENLASLYLRHSRLQDALTQCAIGLVTSPRAKGLRRLLGVAYYSWDMPEQAAEVYRNWMKEEPDDPMPAYDLAALTGVDVPQRASDDFVRATFDGFADSFDGKLATLEYRAPALVGEALAEALGTSAKAWRVADAGCGTGLCAEYAGPYAKSLVGVDLSMPMLKRAATRNAYDELVQGELVAFLQGRPAAFDVLISADTLCYFGDLQAFAQAANASLQGPGWLFFTVESHADEQGAADYRLHGHGRYSHRAGYLRQVLTGAGFADPVLREVTLRKEAKEPVLGWLVSAQLQAPKQPDTPTPLQAEAPSRTPTHG
jgi:predicted TPR repeat methyltransferase